jgi:hypothetical protein
MWGSVRDYLREFFSHVRQKLHRLTASSSRDTAMTKQHPDSLPPKLITSHFPIYIYSVTCNCDDLELSLGTTIFFSYHRIFRFK